MYLHLFQGLKKIVDEKYKKEKEKAKVEVGKVSAVSLTADMWTFINMDAFLAVTCHFIDGDDKMGSVVLGVEHFQQAHTAENLAQVIKILRSGS